jgi:hypothetical protein
MLYLARACYKAGKLKEAKSVLLKVNIHFCHITTINFVIKKNKYTQQMTFTFEGEKSGTPGHGSPV